ncbi:Crp/Fnr family transcriptional regulator [Azospirillum sp. A1-3]|uniref:Crp/Fnr family transcriptional regulator n=1 Tax=Azospirillum sp. A1-3 TaxID=185874 RepID=UPI0020774CC6|nr:Crp/Fnr family transcriptional regulator [Azospirillum sp. A1-3]MCM8735595.1 Crp/Fnr family transcriptional regulator [Azospirillum sp. A1-3]
MDSALARTIADSPVLGQLSEADRTHLLTYSSERTFVQGSALFLRAQPATAFYLVLSGTVGLTVAEDGTCSNVVDIVGPGHLVGEDAVLDCGRHATSAYALLPVTAVAIQAEPFFAHLQDRFEVVQAMMAGATARLRGLIHEITELKLQSTTRRLAGYLVRLAGTQRGRVHIVLPCEKQFLAERLGMKPESLSRAFAKLRAQGVHSGRLDDVDIDDMEALRRFWQSSTDPSWDD